MNPSMAQPSPIKNSWLTASQPDASIDLGYSRHA